MAFSKIHESLVYAANAGEDLSEKLHFLGKIDTNGDIILATTGSVGFPIIEAAALNASATIQFGGIGKAIAGASFNAGVDLAVDSAGKLTTAGSGVAVVGHSLKAADTGDVVSFIVAPAPSP